MPDSQKILKKAKMTAISFKEELGRPMWLRDVPVGATREGKYFLSALVSRKDEDIIKFIASKCINGRFRGFEVEVKEIGR